MTNINYTHACDFQIISLKHHVKKKIKLGESQTQNAWIMTEDCKEWFSREGKSKIRSENDKINYVKVWKSQRIKYKFK